MTKYQLTDNGSVIDRENNRSNILPGVCYWGKYQEWLNEGNTPIPVQPSAYHVLDENEVWVEDVATKEDAEAQATLVEADKKLPRGMEDLIGTLISKDIILATDLPECLQETLVSKSNARKKLKPS